MYWVAGYISNNADEISVKEVIANISPYGAKSSFIINESPLSLIFYSQKEEVFQKNKNFYFEDEEQKCFVIAHIHNRSSLLSQLDLSSSAHDTEIMYILYKRMGIEGLKKCYGKWMYLSFDKKQNTYTIIRDHLGMFNYYYSTVNNSFFFSTNIEWLFRFKPIKQEISPMQLAGLAVGFSGNSYETTYKNVFKIPPAHYVEFTEGKPNSYMYWCPKMEVSLRYKNQDDYYQHFLELFTNIINESLKNADNIASTLSSGLDSTFVTAIAADVLKKQNKSLTAITASPKYTDVALKSPYRYSDEVPLAELVAKKYPNIRHLIDKATETDPINGLIKSIEVHLYPVRNAGNQYWIFSMFEKLKENNVDTLLIGQMGNLTYSWPFFNPIDVKSHFKKTIKKILFHGQPFYIKNSYLASSFIKKNHVVSYLKKLNYKPDLHSSDLGVMRHHFFQQMQSVGYSAWNEKANYYGINVIDPTADVRLIEYCFSIPQKLFKNENGNRQFIRHAAKDIVPNEILSNQKKAIQSADAGKRLLEVYNDYNHLLNQAFNNSLTTELFDKDMLIKAVESNKLSTHIFLRSLLIILFIYFVTNNSDFRTNKEILLI
ncbi:MAG: hypothetical protein Fur0028_02560 [Bacteroidales bacterium]